MKKNKLCSAGKMFSLGKIPTDCKRQEISIGALPEEITGN